MQARQLAQREPSRPKQASLRRAASAAYYALFHLLVDESSRRLISGPKRVGLRHLLARAFSHSDMDVAATAFAKGSPNKMTAALAGVALPAVLRRVAAAFVDLQQARHEADYNVGRRYTRKEVLGLVEEAEAAFQCWQRVRSTLPADAFLVALLVQRRLRG
jgi:hypothetical protein